MKVFISADIEGITTTTSWPETTPGERTYPYHAEQMTKEVVAACEGAIQAGADEIVVRDAHGHADNIDATRLPEQVRLIRGWEGHPYMMVQGIDKSFDAVMFVGYHCAAGVIGNPMCHTMTLRTQKVFVNGIPLSEFVLYSWCAANEGVPAVFLSGDKAVCDQGRQIYPWLKTVAVKEGIGASTVAMSPARAVSAIRQGAYEALSSVDLGSCHIQLPEHFSVQLIYKDQCVASEMSYFPGAMRVDSHTVGLEEDSIFEMARKLKFML